MKIINCEQGSEEWLKARLGIATASNFNKVVTSTGELSKTLPTYALELATELLVTEQEEIYKSKDMERGNELEGEARNAYEEYNFTTTEQVGFMTCGDWGYSPDGLVGKDGLTEYKCPKGTTHTKYLKNNKLPTEYKAQVQGGLFISNRKWCDFVSYHPKFSENKRLFIIRVLRDEKFIKALKLGLNKVIQIRNDIIKEIRA